MKIPYAGSCSITRSILFVFLFFSMISQAQVGIGNTNPDASSALDIKSTTQGLLAPRMTTLQRTTITSPANSLLVYDTDLKSFYYFDTTVLPAPGKWVKLNSASDQRNNYKLVKSVTDLAPELIAGGNTKYLLQTNTYYEINGTINLAVPIDLNNAYVSGMDANEDVLSFSGGVIFKGTTGGSIRNVTLKGAKAFEIIGPGISTNSSLLIQNTIIDGMTTSVGSISALGLYFGNIVQFINNTTGITYSSIGNLLLNNQAWLDSNNGTFETFTGTFGLIEKVSGFSTTNGSDIALDVSTPGLAVSNGVLIGTVFSGTSTYVKPYPPTSTYPGYNFSINWTVDCPGIPREGDAGSTGYYYMVGNITQTQIVSSNTPVKIAGTTTGTNLFRVTNPSSNRLDYKGSKSRNFEIMCTGTVDNSSGTRTYTFYIYKNGVKQNAISAERKFTSNDIGNFTLIGSLNLIKDDYIEVYAENTGNSNDILVTRLSLILK